MKKSLLNDQKAFLEQTHSLLQAEHQQIDAVNNAGRTTAKVNATATQPLNTVTVNSNFTVNGDFEANVGLGQNFAVNVYDEGIEDTARLYYSLNNNAFKFDSELYVRGTAFFGAVACNGVAESAALQSGSLRMSSRPTTPGVRASTWDVIPTEDQSLSFSNLIHGTGGGLRAQLTADGRFKAPTAPLAPEDLTNKAYVDAKVTGLADLSSDQTFTGQKTFLGRIEQKQDEGFDAWYTGPTRNETFTIVDTNNDGLIIDPFYGNKITGDLTATGRVKSALAPTEAEHLTNKEYVDAKVTGLVDLNSEQTITGPKTIGHLSIASYMEFPSASSGQSYIMARAGEDMELVDENGSGLSLRPTGAVISGMDLEVWGRVTSMLEPTDAKHLTNKAYVDGLYSKIDSGSYFPTVSRVHPDRRVNPRRFFYTKINSVVTVTGSVEVDNVAGFVDFAISLPISPALVFVGASDVAGIVQPDLPGSGLNFLRSESSIEGPVYIASSLGSISSTRSISITFSYHI